MMPRRPFLLTVTLGLITLATAAHAEESLLWKVTSGTPAKVVPAYSGEGSPFPVAAPVINVSETEALDEQARLREEAMSYAQGVLSTKALQPEMRMVRVRGTMAGRLGPKVLLNNEWVGEGQDLRIPQVKTSDAERAIQDLAALDAAAASDLQSELDSKLASSPVAVVRVLKITSTSVVLRGESGELSLPLPEVR